MEYDAMRRSMLQLLPNCVPVTRTSQALQFRSLFFQHAYLRCPNALGRYVRNAQGLHTAALEQERHICTTLGSAARI